LPRRDRRTPGERKRTLVPVLALGELVERGVAKETSLGDVRRFDT